MVNIKRIKQRWIFDILDGKAEQERIIFRDDDKETGFILLPDIPSRPGYLVIVNRKDIKSLRDLNQSHLPLLNKIQEIAPQIIADLLSIKRSQIYSYIHYYPAFYHLHIHISLNCNSIRNHLLSSVIENIRLLNNYYSIARLTIVDFVRN